MTDERNLIEIADSINNFNLVIIYPLTGGTSRLLSAAISLTTKPKLIFADDKDNSLPSALSAYKIAKESREKVIDILFFKELDENVVEKIRKAGLIAKVYNELIELNVYFIGQMSNWTRARNDPFTLKEKMGIETIELETNFDDAFESGAEETWRNFFSGFKVEEPGEKELLDSFKIYSFIKKIVKENRIKCLTMDCFKLLSEKGVTPCLAFSKMLSEGIVAGCEGDLASTITMFILSRLSKKGAFMGNIASFSEEQNTVTMTHCTADLKMAADIVKLRNHFESGKSVSVELEFKERDVTVARLISPEYNKILVSSGEIIDGSPSNKEMCRSQVVIKLHRPITKFTREEPGNHTVFTYGNYEYEVKKIAELMGLRTF